MKEINNFFSVMIDLVNRCRIFLLQKLRKLSRGGGCRGEELLRCRVEKTKQLQPCTVGKTYLLASGTPCTRRVFFYFVKSGILSISIMRPIAYSVKVP